MNAFEKTNIKPTQRAEELNTEQFVKLSQTLNELNK